MSGQQRAPEAAAHDNDDNWTQATTQESRWRAGVDRQAQPQAQQHQRAASQAAAAKRKAEAMPEEEVKRRAAAHKREVRAKEKAEKEAAAAAAAARVPNRRGLNRWLKEEEEERCDADEWADFESFICEQRGVSELAELEDEELEQVLALPAQPLRLAL